MPPSTEAPNGAVEVSGWFVVAPFLLGVMLALCAPLITYKVQRALAGQLALEARSYPRQEKGEEVEEKDPPDLGCPPYLSEGAIVDDYAVYVADAAQIFPAMLIPVVGAIFALGVKDSNGIGVGLLLFTVVSAIIIDGWVLTRSAPDYSSRKVFGYFSIVGFVAFVVNIGSLALVYFVVI